MSHASGGNSHSHPVLGKWQILLRPASGEPDTSIPAPGAWQRQDRGEQEGGICARLSPAPAITEAAVAGPSASPWLVTFSGSFPFFPGILSYFFFFYLRFFIVF